MKGKEPTIGLRQTTDATRHNRRSPPLPFHFTVSCPACGASKNSSCRTIYGAKLQGRVHRDRAMKARADQIAKEQQ